MHSASEQMSFDTQYAADLRDRADSYEDAAEYLRAVDMEKAARALEAQAQDNRNTARSLEARIRYEQRHGSATQTTPAVL